MAWFIFTPGITGLEKDSQASHKTLKLQRQPKRLSKPPDCSSVGLGFAEYNGNLRHMSRIFLSTISTQQQHSENQGRGGSWPGRAGRALQVFHPSLEDTPLPFAPHGVQGDSDEPLELG